MFSSRWLRASIRDKFSLRQVPVLSTMRESSWYELLRHLRLLGYGGLIPFFLLALGAWLLPEPSHRTLCLMMLRVYGLSIVSFIGAISWGIAMTAPQLNGVERRQLVFWSVVPSLLGCASFLMPSTGGCLTLAVVAALALGVDLRQSFVLELPVEWRVLRMHLSLGAIACLLLGAYAASSSSV